MNYPELVIVVATAVDPGQTVQQMDKQLKQVFAKAEKETPDHKFEIVSYDIKPITVYAQPEQNIYMIKEPEPKPLQAFMATAVFKIIRNTLPGM